jgi:hypothetical protein
MRFRITKEAGAVILNQRIAYLESASRVEKTLSKLKTSRGQSAQGRPLGQPA